MTTTLKSLLLAGIALTGALLFCTHDGPVAGIEVTNGNCTGTIYTPDSTVAAGATVILIPATYDATDPLRGSIDSTTTDQAGHFTFNVTKSDQYNIIAEKNSASSILEAVPLQPEAFVEVSDTLQQPGTLAGRITVMPEDDARRAIILIRGTNYYTSPTDSGGAFATLPLPAGTFTVQILVPGSSTYASVDTSITIQSGKTTDLLVNLFVPGAPSVTGFVAQHDSVTMHTTLSWDPVDTSFIESYRILRKSAAGRDTLIMVNKTATSCIDDVVHLEDDTVRYQLAAVGKTFLEGYSSTAGPIIPRSTYRLSKVIPIAYDFSTFTGAQTLLLDKNGNFFVTNWMGIQKFDSTGAWKKTYSTVDSLGSRGSDHVYSDDNGNIYYLKSYNTDTVTQHLIVKLSNDLDVISSLKAWNNIVPDVNMQFTVSGDGTIYFTLDSILYNDSHEIKGYARQIRIFDSQLDCVADYHTTSQSRAGSINCFGDTIVIREVPFTENFRFDVRKIVAHLDYYDRDMNAIGSTPEMDFIIPYIPSIMYIHQNRYSGTPQAGPGGTVISYAYNAYDYSGITLITRQQQLICRKASISNIFIDVRGNLYRCNSSHEKQSVTIYKYSEN